MGIRRFLAVALALLVVAACGGTGSLPPSASVPLEEGVLGTGDAVVSGATRMDADLESARRAAAALDAFALDLYFDLARTDNDDLVLSPYSVAIALAMARAGAGGETAAEMDKVLHAASVGDFHRGYSSLEQTLARRSGRYTPPGFRESVELALESANQLWAQQGMPFGAAFLDRLATYYGSGVQLVDFIADRPAARESINDWVADRTRERIPELLPERSLNEMTRFVLTNAVYLKAKWAQEFSKQATAAAPFHRLDGSEVSVQLMHGRSSSYGRGPGYQVTRLPYVGGLSMTVIVPDSGSFTAFETSLRDGNRLASVLGNMRSTYVDLKLPKFEIRRQLGLGEVLGRLGMPTAFTEGADFSEVSTAEKLLLQSVAHEAFIAVDEEGTEAAAATAVIGGATGGPPEIIPLTVDRPFLFLIRDDETGATLFMGRVLDPN